MIWGIVRFFQHRFLSLQHSPWTFARTGLTRRNATVSTAHSGERVTELQGKNTELEKKTKIETSAFYSENAFFRLLLLILINFMEEFVLETNYYENLFFMLHKIGGMIFKIICVHMAHQNCFDFKPP